jgi:hypothetical protein
MDGFIFTLIIQGIVFGGFCGFIAAQKNRNSVSWFIFGFFFSLIAMLALMAIPKLEDKAHLASQPAQESDKEDEGSIVLAIVLFIGFILFLIGFSMMISD